MERLPHVFDLFYDIKTMEQLNTIASEHIKTATGIICTLAQEKYIENAESFYNTLIESAKSIRKEIDINKGSV